MDEALSQTTSNPGHYDRWTCPGCYEDMPNKTTGVFPCPRCERKVTCSLEDQPVCIASLLTEDDDDA